MKSLTIRLRIEPEFKQQLEEAIKEGKAKTISGLIRAALEEFLTNSR